MSKKRSLIAQETKCGQNEAFWLRKRGIALLILRQVGFCRLGSEADSSCDTGQEACFLCVVFRLLEVAQEGAFSLQERASESVSSPPMCSAMALLWIGQVVVVRKVEDEDMVVGE